MSEVNFYHLTQTSADAALPLLLEKVIERKSTAFVQVQTKDRAAALDAHLWVYKPESFLPHVIKGEQDASIVQDAAIVIAYQPPSQENKDMLFLLNSCELPEDLGEFKRVFILFAGDIQDELDFARKQWKDVKAKNLTANYFQQTEKGGWEKKA